jgi:RecA/RadA recombinase
MSKNNDLGEIISLIANENASVAEDGTYADIAGFIDTGSYTLNALLSGSIYKGIPSNKIVAFAGEEATGKTYFVLSVLKHFLSLDKKNLGIIFESEGAITKDLLIDRQIDVSRVLVVPVETVQQFKTQALKIVDNHLNKNEKDRRNMMFLLDSLGMLSTSKEMADTESGKEVKDMTRTQEIKAAFRVLTLKLARAGIPMLVTNHVYQTMGMFPTKELAGGSGLKYSASIIVALGKSKDKDTEGVQKGVKIRCKTVKGRLTREGSEIFTALSFDKGLDRYFGLLELAIEANIFKKSSTKIVLPDGTSVFGNAIIKNPEKYFTEDVLKQLDAFVKSKFEYGISSPESLVDEILENE